MGSTVSCSRLCEHEASQSNERSKCQIAQDSSNQNPPSQPNPGAGNKLEEKRDHHLSTTQMTPNASNPEPKQDKKFLLTNSRPSPFEALQFDNGGNSQPQQIPLHISAGQNAPSLSGNGPQSLAAGGVLVAPEIGPRSGLTDSNPNVDNSRNNPLNQARPTSRNPYLDTLDRPANNQPPKTRTQDHH